MFRLDGPQNLKERIEDIWYEVAKTPRRVKYWFKEKFTKKTIKIETLHGGWWDSDAQLLHANFQILVNYVEQELPNMYNVCGLEKYMHSQNISDKLPSTPREKGEAYLLYTDPHEDDGSDHARRAIEHYNEHKAIEKKVLELYRWWKDIRPARVEVWDTEEYNALGDYEPFSFRKIEDTQLSEMITNKQDPRYSIWESLMEKRRQQEEDWDNEDTAKLIELINLRQYLWT